MLVLGDDNSVGCVPAAMHVHIGQRPMWEFNDKQAWGGRLAVPGLDSCRKFLPLAETRQTGVFFVSCPRALANLLR